MSPLVHSRIPERCSLFFSVLAMVAALVVFADAQTQHAKYLRLKSTIDLPSVAGRIDHMDIDLKTQRVFVAALGNNTIEVVDIKQGKKIEAIRGFEEPQGVLVLPDFNQLCVTNGGAGNCTFLDLNSFRILKTIESLEDADNIRYDGKTKLVYVAYGSGGLAVLDPSKAQLLRSLPLTHHPESFQLEVTGSKLFVNVPGENKVVVFNRLGRALASWKLEGADNNFPMALDERDHLLFVGCRTPARIIVLDTKTGKTVTAIRIGGDVDDVFFDAERRRLYASCGEGFVDVVARQAVDRYENVDRLHTRPGARTSLLVPSLNLLVVAAPRSGGKDAQLLVYSIVNR